MDKDIRNPRQVKNIRLNDPIAGDLHAKYLRRGLTYISNNDAVIPRDAGGNIILNEGAENNPLLLIDPVAERITMQSALKVLDTRFQYYKFPVTVVTEPTADLDINIPVPDVLLKLPVPLDAQQQPVSFDRINTSYASNWFYNDSETSSQGFKELPWIGGLQPTANAYTLEQGTIDSLLEYNKTLKFSVLVQFRAQNPANRTGYLIELQRTNQQYPYGRTWENINLYQVDDSGDGYPYFRFDYILDERDMADQDTFKIVAVAGGPAWSLNDIAFWKIEAVDIDEYADRIQKFGDLDVQQRSRIVYLETPDRITVNNEYLT